MSVHVYSVFALSCVGSDRADPPSKESYRLLKIYSSRLVMIGTCQKAEHVKVEEGE
jgi:hypothetical protein